MEMVDMVITKTWFSGPKSRSANIFVRRTDLRWSRGSSEGFVILSLKQCFFVLLCAVHGIWENLAAWEILLRGVPMICLQFWELKQMNENRRV